MSVDWRNFVEVVEHLDFDLEFVSQAFVMLAGCNLLRQTSVLSNFVLFLPSIQSDLTCSLRHLHNQVVIFLPKQDDQWVGQLVKIVLQSVVPSVK